MTKFYSYVRYSQQGQSKDSVEIQRDIIAGYTAKNGITIHREFIDEGVSGFSGAQQYEGTAYSELMALVKPSDTILVSVMSRFSRANSVAAGADFLSLLRRGINIILCEEGKKYTSSSDMSEIMLMLVQQGVASKESYDKSMYAKKGHERRLRQIDEGKFTVVHRPSWISISKDKTSYFLNEKAEIVKRIFSLCSSGLGATSISQILNEEQIPTFQRAKQWSQAGVYHVLRNTSSYGCYKGKDHFFPAAVSVEQFRDAALAIDRRKTMKTTRTTRDVNVFAGIAYCNACGSRLHVSQLNYKPDRWLICYGKTQGNGCDAPNIRNSVAEIALKEILLKLGAAATLYQTDKSDIIKRLDKASADLLEQESINNDITAKMIAGNISTALLSASQAVDEKVKILKQTKEKLESELINAKDIEESREHFFANIDLSSPVGRRAINKYLVRLNIQIKMARISKELNSLTGATTAYRVFRNNELLWHVMQTDNHVYALPVQEADLAKSKAFDSPDLFDAISVLQKAMPDVLVNARYSALEELSKEQRDHFFDNDPDGAALKIWYQNYSD